MAEMEQRRPAQGTAHRQETDPRQAADTSDGLGPEGVGEGVHACTYPRMLSNDGAARLLSESDADGKRDDSPKRWSALDLEPAEQPRWLADSRLPRAATCLLLGDEGIGKSLLWVLVVAHVTTGTPFPEFGMPPRSPGWVVLVLTEDDWSTVVRPRLEAAKADLSRIEVICTERDGGGSPIFPRDIKLLYAEPTPDIVVVDCWLDTVPSNLRVSDAQHARQALHPWKEVATRTDATVLLLGHTNRVQSPNARDRYGATYALRQKARMTLFAQQDQEGHLVVGPEKANGAPIKPASKFSITGVPFFQPNPENDGTVPLLTYVSESDKTSREHLEDSFADRRKGADKPDPKLWLALFLVGGPRWAEEIEEAAQKAKITTYGLKSAKKDLKVRSQQVGSPKRWFWFLPQHDGQTPEPAEGKSGVESEVDSLYCSKIDPSTSDQFSACFDPAPDDSSTSESRVDSEVESSTAPESGDPLTGSDVRSRFQRTTHRDQPLTLPRHEPYTPPPALPRYGVCDTITGSCDTPQQKLSPDARAAAEEPDDTLRAELDVAPAPSDNGERRDPVLETETNPVPPGGLTNSTPGLTDRVQQALSRARTTTASP